MNKSCFLVLSRDVSILCHLWVLWGHGRVLPLGFAFEGHGSLYPVNSYMCIPTLGVGRGFRDCCIGLGARPSASLGRHGVQEVPHLLLI